MAVVFSLAAALIIGTADIAGSIAGRRGGVLQATLSVFLLGGLFMIPIAAVIGGTPSTDDLVLGAVSGVAGGLGLLALYGGYARTIVGVVAPLAAVIGAVLPVIVGITIDGFPSTTAIIGIVIGLVAIGVIAIGPNTSDADDAESDPGSTDADDAAGLKRSAVQYGLVAGIALGAMVTLLGLTGEDSGIWPLIPARIVGGVVLVGVALSRGESVVARGPAWRLIPLIAVLSGGGMGLYVLAAQDDLVVAGLLLNMAFAVAAVWAVVLFGERTSHVQGLGVLGALVSIVLISIG